MLLSRAFAGTPSSSAQVFGCKKRNVFQTLQVKLPILRILTGLFVLTKSTDISLSRPTMVWRNASHNVGETAHWVWVQCMHCTGSNVQRLSRCSELHSKQPPPHSGIAKIGRPASVWTGIYLCMPLIKRLPCTRTGTAVLATDDPPFIHHLSELLPRLSSGLRVPFAACVTQVVLSRTESKSESGIIKKLLIWHLPWRIISSV